MALTDVKQAQQSQLLQCGQLCAQAPHTPLHGSEPFDVSLLWHPRMQLPGSNVMNVRWPCDQRAIIFPWCSSLIDFQYSDFSCRHLFLLLLFFAMLQVSLVGVRYFGWISLQLRARGQHLNLRSLVPNLNL